jgi:hypothetical protein
MKNLLNPKWLIVVNIIPTIILLLLFYGQFGIIKSLLTTETVTVWLNFSLILIILTLIQLAYIGFSILKKQKLSIYYAFFSLLIYTILLYAYAQYTDILIPFSVPQWMINIDIVLYPGTFLMPTLIHALFILVVFSSRKSKSSSAWISFLYGISVPILGYLFSQIVLPLWQKTESNFELNALIILLIIGSILFLFFICRGIYILTNINVQKISKYAIYLKILIAIILPITGLLVNNGILSFNRGFSGSIFGNFGSIWFYIIALTNGILICLPRSKNNNFRLFRFLGLVICFPYTLYFLFIFLPYLPLAVIAVIAIGIGFLMLSPLFLFILQANELRKEFSELVKIYSPIRLIGYISLAILILPGFITGSNLQDKYVLNNALAYVYSPNYTKTYNINKKSLTKTLARIQQNKERNSFFSEEKLPFLTPYYNWLVLDNMILSDAKINTLGAIFLGERMESRKEVTNQASPKVKISKIESTSKFDQTQQAWVSTVDLELTNAANTNLDSYESEFILPEGCWISNYYLNIGNRKEYGILAEKKAALWVFSQIRNESRDPGILYYLTGNRIAFKVFPFSAKETRKSGIELIHKTPITFNIDDQTVLLGDNNTNNSTAKTESINGAVYIPLNEKAKLKLVKRRPEYHFIMDVSKYKASSKADYVDRINNFINKNQINPKSIKFNFTSAFSKEIDYAPDWRDQLNQQLFEGGFYLEGAIKKILIDNYIANANVYPVIIVITDTLENSILQNDFADFKIAYPESNDFYELDRYNHLWIHSLKDKPKQRLQLSKTIENPGVYSWPNTTKPKAYLANNGLPSIIIDHKEIANNPTNGNKRQWLAGLNLQGIWLKSLINGGQSDKSHLNLIKQSMYCGILSPATSYLVVENEAQKLALKKKQEQILSGNKNLDPDEETQRMDEPNLYVIIVLLIMVFLYKTRYNLNFFKTIKEQT